MGKAFLKKTTSLLQAKRKRKRWQRTMISLSLVVAMVTSCLLIHPAITMERTAICGQEEHTHTEECYEHRLVCGKTEQSAVPATEEKVLNCPKAVHEHGEGCYDAEGQLVCTAEAHNHDDSCYQIIRTEGVEGHTHTDACYEDALICGKQEHTHTEACYPKETEAATQAQTKTVTEAAKTETATEKAETEKATEAEKPEARTLTVKNGEYTIQVDCPADAKIPKNAVLSIREIKKNDSDYNSTYERAASVVLMKTAKKIETVRFFDLSISADGKEIQPKATVNVKITFTKPIQSPEGSEVRVVRLGDDADVLATNTNKANGSWNQIIFKAKKLTVYATAEIAVPVAETAVTETETSEVMMLEAEAEETETEAATEAVTEEVTEAATEEATEAVTEEVTEAATEEATEAVMEEVTEAVTEESTEEPDTEEMTEEDPATPHILTTEGSDYTVEVTYTAEAGIPEGAELQVREIAQGTAEYESYYQQAMAAVQEGDTTSISFARFFDISFVYEGEEIEPSAPVAVKITYADAVEVPEAGEVKSVHFGDEAEVLNVQTNEKNGAMDEVTFDAESFSVYGIVGTETLTKDFITADGETYVVTVTYGPEANIPQNAELSVAEIFENDPQYDEYYDKAVYAVMQYQSKDYSKNKDASYEGISVSFARFLDISITSDGKIIEPSDAVQVSIKCKKDLSLSDNDVVNTVHFSNDNELEILESEYSVKDESLEEVSFETKSFSAYALIGSNLGDFRVRNEYTITIGDEVIIYSNNETKTGKWSSNTPTVASVVEENIRREITYYYGTGNNQSSTVTWNSTTVTGLHAGDAIIRYHNCTQDQITIHVIERPHINITYPDETTSTEELSWNRSSEDSFTTVSSAALTGNDAFRWSDISSLNPSVSDFKKVWDGNYERYYDYLHLQKEGKQYYAYSLNHSYATWRHNSNGTNGQATIRRFQTEFVIPNELDTTDSYRLITSATYTVDGKKVLPINDNLYVFVYKKGEQITDENFMNYLALWTGTSNQNGTVSFHGVTGTQAYPNGPDATEYADRWYCEAVEDNLGLTMYKNYPEAEAGTRFIVDVFTVDYHTGGGMDALNLEITPNYRASVVINYYKDSLEESNRLGTYAEKNLEQDTYHDYSGKINDYKPSEYLDGTVVRTTHNGSMTDPYAIDAQDMQFTVDADGNFVIDIVYRKDAKDLTVNKTWDDNNNTRGLRPNELVVQLYRRLNGSQGDFTENVGDPVSIGINASGNPLPGTRVSGDKNTWTYMWSDLDKRYEYTVKEVIPDGYYQSVNQRIISTDDIGRSTTVNITNTYTTTEADAVKKWKNADGTTAAPENATVVFTLYADGEATQITVTLDGNIDTAPDGTDGYENEAWKAAFVNLPKYKTVNGEAHEIVYTIGETTTYPGYTAAPSSPVESGGTITNSQDTTTVYAIKAWENADGTTAAPENATVVFTLHADGEATPYTVTLNGTADEVPTITAGYESEAWKAVFVNLPKYKHDGTTEIVYTIAETTRYTGYKASTTEPVESGQTITNSQISAEIKLLKIGDGQTSTKLDGAEFELYSTWKGADATDNVKAKNISGQEIGTITTTNGLATIGKLLPGTYYLVETKAPDGYNMLTDPVEIYIQLADQDPGYTVSYKQKGYGASSAAGSLSPDSNGAYLITVSDPSGAVLPNTGGSGTLPYTLGGIALIMASALMYGFRMRRRERRLN